MWRIVCASFKSIEDCISQISKIIFALGLINAYKMSFWGHMYINSYISGGVRARFRSKTLSNWSSIQNYLCRCWIVKCLWAASQNVLTLQQFAKKYWNVIKNCVYFWSRQTFLAKLCAQIFPSLLGTFVPNLTWIHIRYCGEMDAV